MLRRPFTVGTAAVSPRRLLWALALLVPALAAAALIGAGQSNAQSDYYPQDPSATYPPGTIPPPTSPAPTPSPNSTPTPTVPAPGSSPTPTPTPRQGKNTVVIRGTTNASYRFSPRRLRVKRGKRVRWSWNSNAPHNVVFRRLGRRSRTASQGSFALRFRRRGTYRYLCTVHDFGGRVVVR